LLPSPLVILFNGAEAANNGGGGGEGKGKLAPLLRLETGVVAADVDVNGDAGTTTKAPGEATVGAVGSAGRVVLPVFDS
jgi:hypothetical protein